MKNLAWALWMIAASGAGVTGQESADAVTDDFEREDLGGSWKVHGGKVGIIKGDLAILEKGLGLIAWNGAPLPADQFSEAALPADRDPQSVQQVFVRRRAGDSARYAFHWNPAGGGKWEIKFDGVPSAKTRILASVGAAEGPSAGDILRLEARGISLRGLLNGTEVISATDTAGDAITEAGAPGMAFFSRGTSFPVRIFSRWMGGKLPSAR